MDLCLTLKVKEELEGWWGRGRALYSEAASCGNTSRCERTWPGKATSSNWMWLRVRCCEEWQTIIGMIGIGASGHRRSHAILKGLDLFWKLWEAIEWLLNQEVTFPDLCLRKVSVKIVRVDWRKNQFIWSSKPLGEVSITGVFTHILYIRVWDLEVSSNSPKASRSF